MAKTIDRLLLFIKEIGMSARQFDLSIGTANGYTLRMHKNHASVGSDVIEKIVSTYPQINLVWLITGQGHMFLDKDEVVSKPDAHEIEKLVEDMIDSKLSEGNEDLIKRLLEEINKEIDNTKQNK